MQSFRFTLQAVRTLRLRQEQAALAHYLRAVQTHERDRDELRRTQLEQEAAWMRLRQGLPAGLSARQLSQLHAYSWTVEERRRADEAAGQLSLQLMSQAAQSLRLARRQREVVDKYYDKQKRSHDRRAIGRAKTDGRSGLPGPGFGRACGFGRGDGPELK